ncbi:MAG: hypothetical protein C0601_07900 [Candidatus Muiribacterium halophilum]|uniref:Uncharacterized protein n=1 Tax=Muiribacterium halophilum TaxID=2053465 RepID=A0A2N5ZF80_MUIH1|nr:MAG: hypothetical protein C0601_07900 [Candidatus Muirbacterium halophilum]
MMKRKGVLLLTVLLIVVGLAMSISLTIPREVRKVERMKEQTLIDNLVGLETSINNALKEVEFSELCTTPNSIGTYPGGWAIAPNGGRVLTGTKAIEFLDNIKSKGMIIESVYNPPPTFDGQTTSWVVLVTEISAPEDLMNYNSY